MKGSSRIIDFKVLEDGYIAMEIAS